MSVAVVFHKNPLSARLRLLRFADGGLIGPERPPDVAAEAAGAPSPHPGALAARLAQALGLPEGGLRCHAPALLRLGEAPVFAVECTAFEPPSVSGAWIDFTQVRGLAEPDRTLARALYARFVGG